MRRYSFWFFFWARCFGLWGFFHWRWWYDDVTVAWVINMIHSWLQWLGHCWRWILWFFSIFSSILFTAFGNEASLKNKIGKSGWYLRGFGVGFDKTYVLESPNFPSISLSLFELQLPLRPSIFRARDRVIIFASLNIYFYNCNRINYFKLTLPWQTLDRNALKSLRLIRQEVLVQVLMVLGLQSKFLDSQQMMRDNQLLLNDSSRLMLRE